ncbi:transglycosylase SLT domain-containing protein [Gemmatimonas sp.]|uniref:transglycosylase SLT domain-containing protein n=1 Tax=Gemmatimonas sp. TaxID=1962908 RepID=UPI0039835B39
MHRRHAKRRLTNVFVAAAVVFTLAVMVTPEASTRAVVPATPSPGMTPTVAAASNAASLPIQPLWRPAGAVLKRSKVVAAPTLPFGLDPKERERRESLSRWHRIYTYSSKYRIKPELSRRIYDAATTAGIEPELGFRLVRVESVFDTRAVSSAGALGLTQLMLGTAREYEPNVTREQLLDPDVNLRIGFKYLRGLIRDYKGDLKLALLVYNRGPVAVQRSLSMGMSPANGYESIVTKGYRGRGYLE